MGHAHAIGAKGFSRRQDLVCKLVHKLRCLWNPATGNAIDDTGVSQVWDLDFDDEGRMLASIGQDRSLRIFELL